MLSTFRFVLAMSRSGYSYSASMSSMKLLIQRSPSSSSAAASRSCTSCSMSSLVQGAVLRQRWCRGRAALLLHPLPWPRRTGPLLLLLLLVPPGAAAAAGRCGPGWRRCRAPGAALGLLRLESTYNGACQARQVLRQQEQAANGPAIPRNPAAEPPHLLSSICAGGLRRGCSPPRPTCPWGCAMLGCAPGW
jgi:hypothetical protein